MSRPLSLRASLDADGPRFLLCYRYPLTSLRINRNSVTLYLLFMTVCDCPSEHIRL